MTDAQADDLRAARVNLRDAAQEIGLLQVLRGSDDCAVSALRALERTLWPMLRLLEEVLGDE